MWTLYQKLLDSSVLEVVIEERNWCIGVSIAGGCCHLFAEAGCDSWVCWRCAVCTRCTHKVGSLVILFIFWEEVSLFFCHYTLIEVPVSHSLNLQLGFLWVGGWISALLFSWLTSYFWLFILQERRSKLPGCDIRFARIRTFLCLKFGSVFAERTWDQSSTIPGSVSSIGIWHAKGAPGSRVLIYGT